jgi:hypothetical protein
MKKTFLAIVCAVSVIGCSNNEPIQFPTANTGNGSAGGGLSGLPALPADMKSPDTLAETNTTDRDLSVYKPLFTLPKSYKPKARAATVKAKPKTTIVAKKKVAAKTVAKKKVVAKKTKTVAKSKKISKPVSKKSTAKKVVAKKTTKSVKKSKHK